MKKDLLRQLNGLAKFYNDECDYFVNSQDMNVESAKFSAPMVLSFLRALKLSKRYFQVSQIYTIHLVNYFILER
jgi:hypothetical protein